MGNVMHRLDFDLACLVIGNDKEQRQMDDARRSAERERSSRPKTRRIR